MKERKCALNIREKEQYELGVVASNGMEENPEKPKMVFVFLVSIITSLVLPVIILISLRYGMPQDKIISNTEGHLVAILVLTWICILAYKDFKESKKYVEKRYFEHITKITGELLCLSKAMSKKGYDVQFEPVGDMWLFRIYFEGTLQFVEQSFTHFQNRCQDILKFQKTPAGNIPGTSA